MKKIAIIATAPQWQDAPIDDPEWDIWGISGNWELGTNLNRMYELHGSEYVISFFQEREQYYEIAKWLGESYIIKSPVKDVPNATIFDFKKYIEKHRPYFTSSISWIIADAIEQEPDEIGLWGVNMAGDSEYQHQKPACAYLLGYAEAKGIKVTVPESSELLSSPWLYAYEEKPQIFSNLEYRRKLMQAEEQRHRDASQKSDALINYYKGAGDAYEFIAKNYYKGSA